MSRQFSDAEREVGGRIDSFLSAPRVDPVVGGNMDQQYRFILEDLELRKAAANSLEQDQNLAFAQSARMELDRQAQEEAEDKHQATQAFSRITDRQKAGVDFKQAVEAEMAENSGLSLNNQFAGMLQSYGQFTEDSVDRDLRRKKQQIELSQLDTQKFNLSVFERMRNENPQLADDLVNQAKLKIDNEGQSLANQNLRLNIEQIENSRDYDEALTRQAEWDRTLGFSSNAQEAGNQMDSLALMIDSFDQIGLAGVNDPQSIIKSASPGMKNMLASSRWLNRKLNTPELLEAFEADLNTMTDMAGTPEANVARRRVLSLVGQHARETAAIAEQKKEFDAERKLLPEVAKVYGSAAKAIDTISSESRSDSEANSQMIGRAIDFVNQTAIQRGVSDSPELSTVLASIQDPNFSKAENGTDLSKSAVAKKLKEQMRTFASGSPSTQTPTSGIKKMDKATAAAYLRRFNGNADAAMKAAAADGYE